MRQTISLLAQEQNNATLPLAVVKIFKKGDYLYQEKEAAFQIYKVKSGLVMVGNGSEEENTTFSHFITEGELFGEEMLMGQNQRSSYAMVLSEQLEVEVFKPQQLTEYPVIKELLNHNFALVISRIQQTLSRNSTLQLQQRIKDVLLQIGQLNGVNLLNGERLIRMKLKHRELATICNASRQSVTTQLLELVKNGYVKIDRNSILLTQKLILNQ